MRIAVLGDRNLRVLLAGQTMNMFGNSALVIVLGIWVKNLTGSSGQAGLVFLLLAATGFLAPATGLLVDKFPRRSVLVINDTVTALSGSGPAYFFLFMEALEAAAHERGLPNDIAHKLTLATAYGAARMARESHEPLAVLREQVTSQGGTTAAALAVLDAAGLRATVSHAVAAADRRSAELAAEFGNP